MYHICSVQSTRRNHSHCKSKVLCLGIAPAPKTRGNTTALAFVLSAILDIGSGVSNATPRNDIAAIGSERDVFRPSRIKKSIPTVDRWIQYKVVLRVRISKKSHENQLMVTHDDESSDKVLMT